MSPTLSASLAIPTRTSRGGGVISNRQRRSLTHRFGSSRWRHGSSNNNGRYGRYGGYGNRRRQGGGATSAAVEMLEAAADLDTRISASLTAMKAKIPIAIQSIEYTTGRLNREKALLGLGNLLGGVSGMLLGAGGEPYFGKLSLGQQTQVVAQFLYGYGYWGPFLLDLEMVALTCGEYDLQVILDQYRFLTDMDANFGHLNDMANGNYKNNNNGNNGNGGPRQQLTDEKNPTVLSFYAVEMNHDLKRAIYCITHKKGENEDALFINSMIDLYTQLITERLSMTDEVMDMVEEAMSEQDQLDDEEADQNQLSQTTNLQPQINNVNSL